MELGSQNHSRDGLLGPNSIMVVYMDPLGLKEAFTGFLKRNSLDFYCKRLLIDA